MKNKNIRKSSPQSQRKKSSSIRSFGIYYLDDNKSIKYLRFKSIQNTDNSIKIISTFVDDFKDSSKFINSESAKKTIQLLNQSYPNISFKYIDSKKI